MKYIIIFLSVVMLASCHNYKKDAENLQTKVDSLRTLTVQKDSTIDVFLNDFTEIQSNLDSIKKIEAMIDVPNQSERVLNANQKERILSDLATINGLLKDNKQLIANLKSRLNNSNFKSGKLQSMVDELEQTTQNLEANVKQKDAQIAELNQQVQEQSEQLMTLNQKMNDIEGYSARQLDSLRLQEAALNKAYYAVGTVGELKDQGIVEREGGILGIGSTPVISENFTADEFNQVDIRKFNYLPLNSRKADVISVHPVDSYHLSGENGADTLYIDNPAKFWSASKYLVIAAK